MLAMSAGNLCAEYEDGGIGDARLDARLALVGARAAACPSASFPKMFPTEAELEGFYRLMRNARTTPENLLEPHVQSTLDRLFGREAVVAVHDTTEFRFNGERKGLGRLGKAGRGFFGHFSLLVDPTEHEPLGVAAMHTWVRKGETATAKRRKGEISYRRSRELETEQRRWERQVDATELVAGGAASLIHVMDSEADDYALLAKLTRDSRRFVIRLCYDRKLDAKESGAERGEKAKAFLARSQEVCTRTVTLAKRKRRPDSQKRARSKERKRRCATLSLSAETVAFSRPDSQSTSLPKSVQVNIVRVSEPNPPPDAEPVEWLLITSEPIKTEEDILRVVDSYRVRWIIEEYFKALKTGCAYEKRELDSYDTLVAALAVFVPVAWGLLRLRNVARATGEQPPEFVVSPDQLEILRLSPNCGLPRRPTAQNVMLAIAKLGGHLRRNGDPGWQVLGRGYLELLTLTAGYRLAKRKM